MPQPRPYPYLPARAKCHVCTRRSSGTLKRTGSARPLRMQAVGSGRSGRCAALWHGHTACTRPHGSCNRSIRCRRSIGGPRVGTRAARRRTAFPTARASSDLPPASAPNYRALAIFQPDASATNGFASLNMPVMSSAVSRRHRPALCSVPPLGKMDPAGRSKATRPVGSGGRKCSVRRAPQCHAHGSPPAAKNREEERRTCSLSTSSCAKRLNSASVSKRARANWYMRWRSRTTSSACSSVGGG